MLKSIIDNIVSAKEKEMEAKKFTPDTSKNPAKDKKEKKEDRWKTYDEGKKKKIYENTVRRLKLSSFRGFANTTRPSSFHTYPMS